MTGLPITPAGHDATVVDILTKLVHTASTTTANATTSADFFKHAFRLTPYLIDTYSLLASSAKLWLQDWRGVHTSHRFSSSNWRLTYELHC